jgi:hypothetical protein
LSATAGGRLTVSGTLTTGGSSGTSIELSGQAFTNAAGVAALAPGAGSRFLVWSSNPNPFGGGTPDDRGGLAYDFKQYNATYGVTAPAQATGNGFLYTLAPSITPGLTGTVSKGYDGTTVATLVPGNFTNSGIVDGDTVTLTSPGGGSYDTKHVGTGKNVNVTGIAITSATNGPATVYGYQLSTTTASGNVGTITAAPLTVTAQSATKGYDGTTASGVAPVVTGTTYDAVGTAAMQTYDNKNVGTTHVLSAGGLVINDGNSGNNYAITYVPSAATGVITAAALTVTAQSANKGYDGTTSSGVAPVVTGTIYDAVGTAAMQTYDNKNVGTTHVLSASGLVINDGNSGNNYSITYVASPATGGITAAPLTVTAQSDSRGYNGTTSSSVAPVLTGTTYDAVGTAATQTYDNKHVGTTHVLGASGLVMNDGNSGNNYAITYVPSAATGVITAAPLTVTAQTDSRGYNGTTASGAAPVVTGTTYDAVGTAATQTYDNKNVGTTHVLSAGGLVMNDGNSGNNYAITYVASPATGVITAAPLTVTAQSDSRGYNGTTSSSVAPVLTGTTYDAVGTAATQTYDNKNVGTTHVLSAGGLVMNDGNSGNNYAITYVPSAATGVITAAALTVTAQSDSRGYNGTTSSSVAPVVTGTMYDAVGTTATQTYDNKNVGTTHVLSAGGLVMNDGNSGNNYSITYVPSAATGVITAAALTVTAQSDTKTYDGSTSSVLVPVVTSGAIAPGDNANFIQTFNNRNAGTGKTLAASGGVNDGNSGNNYAVTFVTDNTGVINQRAITVAAQADTKTYDGSTSSAVAPAITVGSLAPVGGDSGSFTQAFDTRNAGTGKTLTAAGSVSDGNSGNNYTITFATNTAGVINPRPITVTAQTDTKTYDGSTTSAAIPLITSGSLAPVGGDSASFTQAFANRNAGTGKTLNPSGSVSDGNSGNNYAITFAADNTGVINQRAITVTAQTDTRTYDGSTSSAGTPTITSGTLAPVGGDTANFTQVFANRNAGAGKTLTPAGSVADGNSGNNYAVTFASDNTGVINQRSITVTAQTDTKTYDGSASSAATPVITAGSIAPFGGDTAGFTQTFNNRNAGTGKALTASGSVSDGNSGNNYAVTFVADNTGVINQRPITVMAQADSRTYDGSAASAITPLITSGSLAPVGGDSATFAQTFDSRNVGSGKTLTPTGSVSDGNGGANYALTFATSATGVITARPITVTAQTDTRIYDGSTASSPIPSISSGSLAPIGGDTATFAQTFDNRNAGSGKTLTPTGSVSDGNGGANYAITFAPSATGIITARPITVSAATDTKVYDATTVSGGVPTVTAGNLVGGDTVALRRRTTRRTPGPARRSLRLGRSATATPGTTTRSRSRRTRPA